MSATSKAIVSDLSTCDVCGDESPVFYHRDGKHLCGKHVPPCTRCGGLIHTVDECSLNDSTCQLCGKPSPDGEHQACVDYEAAS